ncbi:MAG: ThaI family type II restriction endonuclease [Spirochaetes bacterium]|nr:ThaI family type II restriction endonuclease [Spirochaetota bacterium]
MSGKIGSPLVRVNKLIHIAELESSRTGKVGMESGSVREKIITS